MRSIAFIFSAAIILAMLVPAHGGEEKSDKSPEELVELLGHSEYAIRENATEKLLAMGRRAESALRSALESDDPEIKWRAEAILLQIRASGERIENRVRAVLSTLGRARNRKEQEQTAFRRLNALGSGVPAAIVKLLPEYVRDYRMLTFLCTYLELKGGSGIVPGMVETLMEGNYMPSTIINSLFRIDRAKAGKLLADRLRTGEVNVKKKVLDVFYMAFSEEFAALATPFAKHENRDVRRSAVRIISRSAHPDKHREILRGAMDDADIPTRMAALGALARTKDPDALTRLLAVARDKKAEVRFRINAISNLANYDDERVKKLFLEILLSADVKTEYMRRHTAHMLARINKDWCFEVAEKLLSGERPEDRRTGVLAMRMMKNKKCAEKIKKLLSDPDPRVRAEAVDAVADLVDDKAEALRLLTPFLKSEDRFCNSRAVWAVARLKTKAAVDALIDALLLEYRVAHTAENSLRNLTRHSFGNIRLNDPEANRSIMEQWKKWWNVNKDSFEFR